jgi:hypothetical protein
MVALAATGAKEAAEKIGLKGKCTPQQLKPHLFAMDYGRAEQVAEKLMFCIRARLIQNMGFPQPA